MNDVGNLLQMIYDLLTGWYNSFTSHALAVMEKLNLIETDTASIKNSASDIKSNTDDIKDNTGAIITPVQSIKTNTDSIKTDTTTIKNNVSTMSNQLGTISTNVGTASAFTEDVANNTLDIKDRIVTIGSDTTQLRSNSNSITSDVSDIKTALNYYLSSTPVTEDVEGNICNFDTDLFDYLQLCKVTIPSDLTGFTGIILTKCGKNLFDKNAVSLNKYLSTTTGLEENASGYVVSDYIPVKSGVPVVIPYSNSARRWFYDINKQPTTYLNNTNLQVFTPTNDGFIRVTFNVSVASPIDINTIQIEIGTSQSSFESYKNMTYPVSFGSAITDGAEVDLLEGLIKINSIPVSYQSITPVAVRTYKGINNIYSDVGTTALTYRETLKHYMDKQEA